MVGYSLLGIVLCARNFYQLVADMKIRQYEMQKSDAGVGIGTLVGANAPTPPYGGGYRPHTPLKSACRPP